MGSGSGSRRARPFIRSTRTSSLSMGFVPWLFGRGFGRGRFGRILRGSSACIGWLPSFGLFASRGRDSARRRTHFLLLRQKKVSKEKATPLSASLRFAAGNLRCSRFAGSRRTRFAQTAASPDPRNTPLLGAARGEGDTRGHRVARPPLRALRACSWLNQGQGRAGQGRGATVFLLSVMAVPRPSAAMARRFPIPNPSGCAEERSVSRIRARSCLSEAERVLRDPAKREHRRLPVAKRRGRRQQGRLFFAYFLLAKQRK
jgi:hypothetical protein